MSFPNDAKTIYVCVVADYPAYAFTRKEQAEEWLKNGSTSSKVFHTVPVEDEDKGNDWIYVGWVNDTPTIAFYCHKNAANWAYSNPTSHEITGRPITR